MIYFFVGENSFEISRAVSELAKSFDGSGETVEGSDLTLEKLPQLLSGATLFSEKRLVVIKNLSENKVLWEVFGDWLDRVSEDVTLVLVEAAADKRTRTFKTLKARAEMREFDTWQLRDNAKAASWLVTEAKQRGLTLDAKIARLVVDRVGVDQWQLHFALDKLAALETIDEATVKDTIDDQPDAQVFGLFEAALVGDAKKIHDIVNVLRTREDAYRTFGLLAGQVMQSAALFYGPDEDVAKDLGAHPYALNKLRPLVRSFNETDIELIINSFAAADDDIKTSGSEPWQLVERALVQVAARSK